MKFMISACLWTHKNIFKWNPSFCNNWSEGKVFLLLRASFDCMIFFLIVFFLVFQVQMIQKHVWSCVQLFITVGAQFSVRRTPRNESWSGINLGQRTFCFRTLLSRLRLSVCQATAFFFVLLVSGFSTASYLKVHIKTHHGSPLPPSATMHTFPEPRGELQMHNGTPYHMGRQCSVEGKQPPAPSQTFMFLAFICSAAFYLEKHAAASLCLLTQAYISSCFQAFHSSIYCCASIRQSIAHLCDDSNYSDCDSRLVRRAASFSVAYRAGNTSELRPASRLVPEVRGRWR